MEKTKKEEPEFVSMGVATPTSGFDTIKRAEMRVADTDTFKGRVLKMPEDEMVRLKVDVACSVASVASALIHKVSAFWPCANWSERKKSPSHPTTPSFADFFFCLCSNYRAVRMQKKLF